MRTFIHNFFGFHENYPVEEGNLWDLAVYFWPFIKLAFVITIIVLIIAMLGTSTKNYKKRAEENMVKINELQAASKARKAAQLARYEQYKLEHPEEFEEKPKKKFKDSDFVRGLMVNKGEDLHDKRGKDYFENGKEEN